MGTLPGNTQPIGEVGPVSPLPPGEGPGVRGAASPSIPEAGSDEQYPASHAPHPGPLPEGEGGKHPLPVPGGGSVGPGPREGIRRQTVEFLLLLGIGILLLRTFAAEAYVVPTGSMAPTLLGFHKELTCPNCRYPFVLGMDDQGRIGRPICPNCGKQDGMQDLAAVECNGDRLLVQKFLFDIRRPRRWEVAVFQSPAEPDQAYVKRVVGLPGETIQIVDGDVYIDGKIARKTLQEQRAMRILVFDNDFVPGDADRFPRWRFRVDRSRRATPSGWRAEGSRFVREPVEDVGDRVDWLEYLHFDPDRSRYGPIRDYCPYNGGDIRGENVVTDLMVEADVSVRPDAKSLAIRLDHGGDHFQVTLPVDGRGRPEVSRNGRSLEVANARGGLASSPKDSPKFARLVVSTIDRRLTVALDDIPLFDPIDFERARAPGYGPPGSPVALGISSGSMEVRRLRIDRDLFYTGNLAVGPRRPFAVDTPYVLGEGEFFVLGDNSPVSNDSRFWESSPVVKRDQFLGKPFLVHLPGQVCPLRVFGRPLGWIPDPREIRYIR
jgi:signal peptidase I